ncbi:MAG: creatininase family protein [Limisphaerales bacterium]
MDFADLSAPALASLPRDIPVVIPIAALEQHGQHLPVFTDSLLLGEIVRRVRERLAQQVLFVPLLWLGNSDHHLDFQGTLSAPPRTYLDVLSGLAENLLQQGFRRLVFLNGHGGNDVPGRQALFEVRQRHRNREDLLLLLATYWASGPGPSTGGPALHQKEMGHACEWETSMILRLAPQLVGTCQGLEPVPPGNPFLPASRAWITRDRTTPGHIGWPHLASAEKGEFLFHAFSEDVVSLLQRVIRWDGRTWEG